jgi:hypothetical protein
MAANTHSLDLEASSSQYAFRTDADQTGLDITGDLTVEAWVKFESLPSGGEMVVASKWDDNGSNDRSWFFYTQEAAGTYYIAFYNSSTGGGGGDIANKFVTWTPSTATWYHLAMAYDASAGTVDFYLNGSQQGTQQSGSKTSMYNSGAPFLVGARNDPSTSFFDGLIDEVRVWDDIRTSGEILANYNTHLVGNEANLKGYWRFNNSALDETSNNNDLTLANSPSYSADVPFTIPEGGNPLFFSGGVTIG